MAIYPYPPEGVPITAFDDKHQAERFAVASTTSMDTYEAVAAAPRPALSPPAVDVFGI
jgi:hypothetical protein